MNQIPRSKIFMQSKIKTHLARCTLFSEATLILCKETQRLTPRELISQAHQLPARPFSPVNTVSNSWSLTPMARPALLCKSLIPNNTCKPKLFLMARIKTQKSYWSMRIAPTWTQIASKIWRECNNWCSCQDLAWKKHLRPNFLTSHTTWNTSKTRWWLSIANRFQSFIKTTRQEM